MIKIYHKTKKKIGLLYFQYFPGESLHENIVKSFESELSMKSWLIQMKIDDLRFSLDRFIVCFTTKETCENDLDSKALETLQRLNHWINDGDKEYEIILDKIRRQKPYFETLIKTATNNKEDLALMYKFLIEGNYE